MTFRWLLVDALSCTLIPVNFFMSQRFGTGEIGVIPHLPVIYCTQTRTCEVFTRSCVRKQAIPLCDTSHLSQDTMQTIIVPGVVTFLSRFQQTSGVKFAARCIMLFTHILAIPLSRYRDSKQTSTAWGRHQRGQESARMCYSAGKGSCEPLCKLEEKYSPRF